MQTSIPSSTPSTRRSRNAALWATVALLAAACAAEARDEFGDRLIALPPAAAADVPSQPADAPRAAEPDDPRSPQVNITQDAAVAMVRDRTGGRVVRVRQRADGATLVYLIRVLSADGRVQDFSVDATTGQMRGGR